MSEKRQFSIQAFAREDAEACSIIYERAYNSGHPYDPRTINVRDFLRETQARTVLVARSGASAVLGFVSVEIEDDFINHLYVDPDHARRGVGAALLLRALELLGGRASLKCQLRNEAALRFYRREGWRKAEQGGPDEAPWVRLLSPDRRQPALEGGG